MFVKFLLNNTLKLSVTKALWEEYVYTYNSVLLYVAKAKPTKVKHSAIKLMQVILRQFKVTV